MERTVTTEEIAEGVGKSASTIRSYRNRAWRLLHPDEPKFPDEVIRGVYRAAEVAAWFKDTGRGSPPPEWEKA